MAEKIFPWVSQKLEGKRKITLIDTQFRFKDVTPMLGSKVENKFPIIKNRIQIPGEIITLHGKWMSPSCSVTQNVLSWNLTVFPPAISFLPKLQVLLEESSLVQFASD